MRRLVPLLLIALGCGPLPTTRQEGAPPPPATEAPRQSAPRVIGGVPDTGKPRAAGTGLYAKSAEDTAHWVEGMEREVRRLEEERNILASKQKREEMFSRLRDEVDGREVRWKLAVVLVSESRVALEAPRGLELQRGTEVKGAELPHLSIPSEVPAETAIQWRRGMAVTVTGKLTVIDDRGRPLFLLSEMKLVE